jgi:hypothetical protein
LRRRLAGAGGACWERRRREEGRPPIGGLREHKQRKRKDNTSKVSYLTGDFCKLNVSSEGVVVIIKKCARMCRYYFLGEKDGGIFIKFNSCMYAAIKGLAR